MDFANKDHLSIDKKYLINKEKQIYEDVINEDREGAIEKIKEIINVWQREDLNIFISYLEEFSIRLYRKLNQFINNEEEIYEMKKIGKDIINLNNIIEIEEYMEELIQSYIKKVIKNRVTKEEIIVQKAKKYIEINFCKRCLSLNTVAEEIGISPFYLSKIFKKVAGNNFKDYIIKIRMEYSKILLRHENKSIKDVTYEVGYTDPNYFSRAFKKYTGVSPTAFINYTKSQEK